MGDFVALLGSDHDDLDRALALLVNTSTPVGDLLELQHAMRVALAVHVTAEARVLDRLLARAGSGALRSIVQLVRRDHREQQARADALGGLRAGCADWFARANELRQSVLDHAWQTRVSRSLSPHVSLRAYDQLANEYAAERARVFATTSPVALAQALLVS